MHPKDWPVERRLQLWDADSGKDILDVPTLRFVDWIGEHRLLAETDDGVVRLVPVSPLDEALQMKPRGLFFDEIDRYQVGGEPERQIVRESLEAAIPNAEAANRIRASELSETVRDAGLLSTSLRSTYGMAQDLNRESWDLAMPLGRTQATYDESVDLAQKARALSPHDTNIANTLGVAYLRARRYGDAIATLQDLIAKPGRRKLIDMIPLAIAQFRSGDGESAKSTFAEVAEVLRHRRPGARADSDVEAFLAEARALGLETSPDSRPGPRPETR
jgi:hypothetical protein